MRLALVALLVCCALVGSQPTATQAGVAPEFEVLMPSQDSKGWRVLHEEQKSSPLDEDAREHASFVEDWLSTEPVVATFPVPKFVMLVCGMLIAFGAYRVATRD